VAALCREQMHGCGDRKIRAGRLLQDPGLLDNRLAKGFFIKSAIIKGVVCYGYRRPEDLVRSVFFLKTRVSTFSFVFFLSFCLGPR
jgi:hypothetical protein